MTAIREALEAVVRFTDHYHCKMPTLGDDEALAALGYDAKEALAALDAETPATPADVGEEPVALVEQTISGETVAGVPVLGWMWEVDAPLAGKTRQTAYHWSTPPSDVKVTRLIAATALERVVRERDEARAAVAYEAGDPDAFKYHKALFDKLHSAEAKLAEARKVIDDLKQNARVAIDAGEVLIGVLLDEKQALRARLETVEAETRKRSEDA